MANEKWLIDANAVVEKLEYEIETQCEPVADSDSGVEAFIKMVLPKLLRDVINYIKQQPPVDAVEVVHGRWILKDSCGKNTGGLHCSVCDKMPKSLCVEDFCPNCGAIMDGDING